MGVAGLSQAVLHTCLGMPQAWAGHNHMVSNANSRVVTNIQCPLHSTATLESCDTLPTRADALFTAQHTSTATLECM
jgi:hypothetical protein